MKKKLALLLALLMVFSLGLYACGGDSGNGGGDQNGDDADPNAGGEEGDALKVHLIISALGDKSFLDSADRGLKAAQENLNVEYTYTEYGNDHSKIESTFLDIADSGLYDVIIQSGGNGFDLVVQEHAAAYPDTYFILFDMAADTVPASSNIYALGFKQNECSYLVGALGASMSETGILGCVMGMEYPVINDFLVGYIYGALRVNEDIRVLSTFIGNFNDTAKAKELTISQIGQGADLVYNVAGQAGIGIIEGCAENDVLAIGVDSDQYNLFIDTDPAKANAIVTSALKNVDNGLYRAIEMHLEGNGLWGTYEQLGIAEGGVGYADNENFQRLTTEEQRTLIAQIEQEVIDGEYEVPTVFNMTTEEFTELKNAVK